jgi:hypothetical protein
MAKAKKIVFKTKDGKEVSFKKKPGAAKERKVKGMKAFEKRLSAMEKAVIQYNSSVQKHREKKEKEKGEKKVVNIAALTAKKPKKADSDSD